MSLTPDQFRKVTLGMTPSPAPFLTPRPERRRPDSRGADRNLNRQEKDRGEANVQVLLRCRPLNDDEQRSNVPRVVTCNEHKREVTILQSVANKQVDKAFMFDKVFGPKSQQRSIYDQAISPIVNEVLEGFNCTVFAYGQTGTGKTYTMEGGMRNKGGELPAEAGVIPRSVRHIFDTLEAQNADYSMKVTFLELYNEEITDLLAQEDYSRSLDEKQKKSISLMEDGKGSVILRGLEEEAVYSANEIYNLLERGAAKRRTADTLLNKRSSRSHSVFTITVYVKEAALGDEELIKCGKLNLVDLAGSENISRSGAREGRAREAGEINKSLLTLGRVINALVEHSVHVPYRDSKLTRLLRDSLGGKTKTCIIATISPSAHCLEETLSTLDYAYRAKNIKNKPEANQKISKAVLLKDLYVEIERMKQDVRAAREKNGVYIPHERFMQDEAEKKAKNEKIEQLEIDISISKKEADKFRELYLVEQEQKLNVENELKSCRMNLENSDKALQELQESYSAAISMLKEKETMISKLQHSENGLIECAKELRTNLQYALDDRTALFAKLDQKNKLEAENQCLLSKFGSHLDESLKNLHKTILGSVSHQQQQLRYMEENARSFFVSKSEVSEVLESRIKKMSQTHASGVAALKDLYDMLQKNACSDLEQANSTILSQTNAVEYSLKAAVSEANDVICDVQNSLTEQRQFWAFSAQRQEEALHRSLLSSQMISTATIDFFNDLSQRASQLMSVFEESLMEKSHHLASFEKMFKEEAIREENSAVEKITAILANLTTSRTAMVSEATRKIQESSNQENRKLMQELSNMKQVSAGATNDVNGYLENLKTHFMEDTFALAGSRVMMENYLQDCANKVYNSRQQWDDAQLSISRLNKSSIVEIESSVKQKIGANHTRYHEFFSACSSMDVEFGAQTRDLLTSVKDSLVLDHENKKEIESMCTTSSDQLKSAQQNHGEGISEIQKTAYHCLKNDYLVDPHTNMIHENRAIRVPSLASIEEMRTLLSTCENRPNWGTESKIQQQQQQLALPNRTPFAHVNRLHE